MHWVMVHGVADIHNSGQRLDDFSVVYHAHNNSIFLRGSFTDRNEKKPA